MVAASAVLRDSVMYTCMSRVIVLLFAVCETHMQKKACVHLSLDLPLTLDHRVQFATGKTRYGLCHLPQLHGLVASFVEPQEWTVGLE